MKDAARHVLHDITFVHLQVTSISSLDSCLCQGIVIQDSTSSKQGYMGYIMSNR